MSWTWFWFDLFVAYVTTVEAAIRTADVWLPLLLLTVALVAGARCRSRPDVSGRTADTPAETTERGRDAGL
ncbi:hypothetical protein AB0A05_07660 [Streptomyces sp. NPDC046374]|uniref:hypothetical protein n=1 Tax=Streptomyces sp. NPDC046374 TaxID=3154917 RepID=UPI00340F35E1